MNVIITRSWTEGEVSETTTAEMQDVELGQPTFDRIVRGLMGGYLAPPDAVKAAYAKYDTDKRVHGPDDFEAFQDAVADLLK